MPLIYTGRRARSARQPIESESARLLYQQYSLGSRRAAGGQYARVCIYTYTSGRGSRIGFTILSLSLSRTWGETFRKSQPPLATSIRDRRRPLIHTGLRSNPKAPVAYLFVRPHASPCIPVECVSFCDGGVVRGACEVETFSVRSCDTWLKW